MKKNEVYIVTAYKWGDNHNHSYNLGVFNRKQKAQEVAESHCTYRGGKYSCVVEKCILNEFDNDTDDYTPEIYRAKGMGDFNKTTKKIK